MMTADSRNGISYNGPVFVKYRHRFIIKGYIFDIVVQEGEKTMNEIIYDDALTAEEYNQLREAVGWLRLTDRQAERGLEHTTFLVAAKEDEKTIGMGRVLFDFGYVAYIGDVIIRPEYQGKGIGKKIVELLMKKVEEAADSGDKIMFLLGAAKGKEAFYEKLGFEIRPSEYSGAGMTKWIKVK
jgi:GNAT superfamily N-acetyltransferase